MAIFIVLITELFPWLCFRVPVFYSNRKYNNIYRLYQRLFCGLPFLEDLGCRHLICSHIYTGSPLTPGRKRFLLRCCYLRLRLSSLSRAKARHYRL